MTANVTVTRSKDKLALALLDDSNPLIEIRVDMEIQNDRHNLDGNHGGNLMIAIITIIQGEGKE